MHFIKALTRKQTPWFEHIFWFGHKITPDVAVVVDVVVVTVVIATTKEKIKS